MRPLSAPSNAIVVPGLQPVGPTTVRRAKLASEARMANLAGYRSRCIGFSASNGPRGLELSFLPLSYTKVLHSDLQGCRSSPAGRFNSCFGCGGESPPDSGCHETRCRARTTDQS